jgi:hypothetical protein
MTASPDAAARIKKAALGALDDPDSNMRTAAVGVLFYFRNDAEVRSKLAEVATNDPYQEGYDTFRVHPGRLTVREAARNILDASSSDDNFYFIIRNLDTEAPSAARYIGPQRDGLDGVKHMLCSHVTKARATLTCAGRPPPRAHASNLLMKGRLNLGAL